ncbi:MAG: hypothetical protein V4607_01515 [Pseudomonadota bacterium]
MKKVLLISVALSVLSFSAQAATECGSVEASAPASAAAPAVVAAAAPQVTKATAVVPRAVALRDRPQLSSVGDVVVPADKKVRLSSTVNNSDGNWWYVTADGLGGGWVPESDMSGLQQQ